MLFTALTNPKTPGLLFLFGIGAGASAADLQTLVHHSPFAPTAGIVAARTEEPETLEFRGLVVDERGTTYSLFDTTAKRSYWVREGGKGAIRVKAFDAGECVLEVEQNGKALTLPLKSATIATAAAPVAVPVVRVDERRPVRIISRPAAAAGENRVANVAAEIRRRRALRQATAEGRTAEQPAMPASNPGF